MVNPFTVNLVKALSTAPAPAPAPVPAGKPPPPPDYTWPVFLCCLIFSAAGVFISFLVFGSRITGIGMWGAGFVIAIAMLGISYGAKYANLDARNSFTPVDLIQYLSQGFLWPSTWPALADFIGVQKISPPQATSWLLSFLEKMDLAMFVW